MERMESTSVSRHALLPDISRELLDSMDRTLDTQFNLGASHEVTRYSKQVSKNVSKKDLKQLKQDYDGGFHSYKLQRSPSLTFQVADSVISPSFAMNKAQEHSHNTRHELTQQARRIHENKENKRAQQYHAKRELSRLIDNKIDLYKLLDQKPQCNSKMPLEFNSINIYDDNLKNAIFAR